MGAPFFILIGILVLAAVVIVALRRYASERNRIEERLESPSTETLEYVVPEGQDPVTVITPLQREGFDVALDPRGDQLLRIGCPAGAGESRERARAIIEQVRVTAIDHGAAMPAHSVVFQDEH